LIFDGISANLVSYASVVAFSQHPDLGVGFAAGRGFWPGLRLIARRLNVWVFVVMISCTFTSQGVTGVQA
jgi:hypothetical protein